MYAKSIGDLREIWVFANIEEKMNLSSSTTAVYIRILGMTYAQFNFGILAGRLMLAIFIEYRKKKRGGHQ